MPILLHKMVLSFESVGPNPSVANQLKADKQYSVLVVLFVALFIVVLSCESLDEILQ